jgi:hypothetical protein
MMRELNLSATHSRISTERILFLLVESGFIYMLLWVRGYARAPLVTIPSISGQRGHCVAQFFPGLALAICLGRHLSDGQPNRGHVPHTDYHYRQFPLHILGGGTSRIGNNISLSTLRWKVKRGPTDTWPRWESRRSSRSCCRNCDV